MLGKRTLLATLLTFAAAASVTLAQLRPLTPTLPMPHPIAPVNGSARPQASASPLVRLPLPGGPLGAHGRMPGTIVPLAQLPPLPAKTDANTATPRNHGRVRPMAATGATIYVSAANTTGNCVNTVGTLYALNCSVNWTAQNMPSGGTYQDYYIAPNVANGQAGTTAGGTYTSTNGTTHTQQLTVSGLYVFATLNTSTNQWAAVTYITVSTAFVVKVYQDAFHTTESYQFDSSSSGNAYIYGTNLSPSDYYEVYVESTSVNPQCVFMAPAGTITAGKLCNVSTATGTQAPNGQLSITWPILSTYSGVYSVVIYDVTQNQRLGQVQVAVTGSNGRTISMYADATTANPSPNPAPVSTTTQTLFAWDSSNDRSASGVKLSVAAVPAGTYTWSVSNPDGETYASSNVTTSASSTLTNTFTFSNFALPPGNFVPKVYTAQLYDTVNKAVYASQVFQLLGYYVNTTLNGAQSLDIAQGGSTTATLVFTNNSANKYGSDNADSFSKLIFTTGTNFTPSAGGDGIEAWLSGGSFAGCTAAAPCTQTVTDSAGNSWTITNICGSSGGTAECTIEADPVNSNVHLAPGAYITISNVNFANATNSQCTNSGSCSMQTSVLPQHGLTWSQINTYTDAYAPVYVSAGNNLTGTGYVNLAGANDSAYSSTTSETVEAHLYRPNTNHAHYARTSPYTIDSSYYNILHIHVTNNSKKPSSVIAVGLPGSYGSLTALDNFAIDPNLNASTNYWYIDTSCANATTSFGRKYLCLDGTGTYDPFGRTSSVGANGGTADIYMDVNAAPSSFNYTDWVLELANPYIINLTADATATATIPIGSAGSFTVDGLAYAQYSLDSGLMQANFAPSTTGSNSTANETVTVTNTSFSADTFPDYVDNVLIGLPNGYTVSGISASTSGWTYLGSVYSNALGDNLYWFSVCNKSQATTTYLPPTSTPLTARATALPQCSASQLLNALAPGGSLNVAMTIGNVNTSNITAVMYAHGANGGGWSAQKTLSLGVQSVSASVGFSGAGGYATPAPVATNTVPTIGGDANSTYGNAYQYAVKNTSSSGSAVNITSFAVIVPGTDISGVNATDSSGQTWTLTGTPTLSGNTDGCTVVGTASATTSGGNGYIDIGGTNCKLLPGDTIYINFTAKGPQSQGDSYQFSTQNLNGSGTLNSSSSTGLTGSENWIGDSRVQVSLTIGLNLSVNPSNPGPGGSTAAVSCASCSFSGTTVDFGAINNSTTDNFGDIVLASVYITSSTAVNWTLSVSTNSNPARTPSTPTNELLTSVDSTNSSQSAGITFDQTSYAVVPIGSNLQVAHGTSITTRTTPYDVLSNYQVNIGTEALGPVVSTVTYTLVAN